MTIFLFTNTSTPNGTQRPWGLLFIFNWVSLMWHDTRLDIHWNMLDQHRHDMSVHFIARKTMTVAVLVKTLGCPSKVYACLHKGSLERVSAECNLVHRLPCLTNQIPNMFPSRFFTPSSFRHEAFNCLKIIPSSKFILNQGKITI